MRSCVRAERNSDAYPMRSDASRSGIDRGRRGIVIVVAPYCVSKFVIRRPSGPTTVGDRFYYLCTPHDREIYARLARLSEIRGESRKAVKRVKHRHAISDNPCLRYDHPERNIPWP